MATTNSVVVVYGISRHTEALAFLRACQQAAVWPDTMLIDERRRAIAMRAQDCIFLKASRDGSPVEWVRDAKLWPARVIRDLRRRLEFAKLDPSAEKLRIAFGRAPAKHPSAAS